MVPPTPLASTLWKHRLMVKPSAAAASRWRSRRTFAAAATPASSHQHEEDANKHSTTTTTTITNLITSTKSNTVKTFRALLSKRKARNELQATVVEGPRMVQDLVKNPKTRPLVQQILVSIERQDKIDDKHDGNLLLATLQHHSIPIRYATPQVLAACSDTVTPQGILAIVSIPSNEEAISENNNKNKQSMYLVLDGVSDPGNVGTLLRSCVAVGVAGVLLLPDCCDVWNPKAVRSAMGCTFQVPILRNVESLEEALTYLAKRNVRQIYAATMLNDDDDENDDNDPHHDTSRPPSSVPHYDMDWTQAPSALFIGKEGSGLSRAVRQAVAEGRIRAVHVPMEEGIESLNAAVCGSVILFEYLRQCRTVDDAV